MEWIFNPLQIPIRVDDVPADVEKLKALSLLLHEAKSVFSRDYAKLSPRPLTFLAPARDVRQLGLEVRQEPRPPGRDGLAVVVVVAVHRVAAALQHHRHVTVLPAAAHPDARGHAGNLAQVGEVSRPVPSPEGRVVPDVAVLARQFGVDFR